MEETFGAIWSEKQTEAESEIKSDSSKLEDFKRKLSKLKSVSQSMSLLNTPVQGILYLVIRYE